MPSNRGVTSALSGIAGFATGLADVMQDYNRRLAALRQTRAQVYLDAVKANPSLADDPNVQATIQEGLGIAPEDLLRMFPTPEQRLEQAIPGIEAAAGVTPPPPAVQGGGRLVEPPPGAAGPFGPGSITTGDVPTVRQPTAKERLANVASSLPPGRTLQFDPVTGEVKITVQGPPPVSKRDEDESFVTNMFLQAIQTLRDAYPGASDDEIVLRAAQEALIAASEQDRLVPETIRELALAPTEEARQLRMKQLERELALRYAAPQAEAEATGRARGQAQARQEELARQGLVPPTAQVPPGTPQAPPGPAQVPPGMAQAAPAAPAGPAPPTQPAPVLQSYDSPEGIPLRVAPEPAPAPAPNPSPRGFRIGPRVHDEDLNVALTNNLVISRMPDGTFVARPQHEAQARGEVWEEPDRLIAWRLQAQTAKSRALTLNSAKVARGILQRAIELQASSLLPAFGVPLEEVRKRPLGHLAAYARVLAQGNVVTPTQIAILERAGDARVKALRGLQSVATPLVKAFGDVGQITEPDKAPVYILLRRVWEGRTTKEDADVTLQHLLKLLDLFTKAPTVTPEMARLFLFGRGSMEETEAEAVRLVEEAQKKRPGTLEAESFLQGLPGPSEQ